MKTNPAERAEAALRAVALGFPEAYEDHPWGDTVFKVKGKVFVFLGAAENGDFGISAKLPLSGAVALMLPFAHPTRYGLGKSGWISARFGPKEEVPLDMLASWIDESYRAIAPKKLVRSLPKEGLERRAPSEAAPEAERSPAKPAPKKPAKPAPKKAPAKKPTPKTRATPKKTAPAKPTPKAKAPVKPTPAREGAAAKKAPAKPAPRKVSARSAAGKARAPQTSS